MRKQEDIAPKYGSERSVSIDAARGIAIVLVMYGHALELSFLDREDMPPALFYQWQVIYSFHMPLFFIISGLLYRTKPLVLPLSNTLFMILMACSYHVVGWVMNIVLGHHETARTLLVPIFYLSGLYPTVMWFLVALGLSSLAYSVIAESNRAVSICVIAVIFIMFTVAEAFHRNHFQAASILPAVAFYGIGHYIARKDIVRRFHRHAVIAIPLTIATTCLLAPLNRGCPLNPFQYCSDVSDRFVVWMVEGRVGFLPLFMATAVAGSLGIMLVADALVRWKRPALAVSWLGSRTIHVLVINGFVFEFLQPPLRHFIDDRAPVQTGEAWAVLLVAGQIALLPVIMKVTEPFHSLLKSISGILAGLIVKWVAFLRLRFGMAAGL
jgi:acyltransferase